MLFVANLTWRALLLKTVKRMLYLGYISLRYVLTREDKGDREGIPPHTLFQLIRLELFLE